MNDKCQTVITLSSRRYGLQMTCLQIECATLACQYCEYESTFPLSQAVEMKWLILKYSTLFQTQGLTSTSSDCNNLISCFSASSLVSLFTGSKMISVFSNGKWFLRLIKVFTLTFVSQMMVVKSAERTDQIIIYYQIHMLRLINQQWVCYVLVKVTGIMW